MAQIKLDASCTGVVMQCRSCGVWFAFAFDLAEAHDRAVQHESRTHPGSEDAYNARRKWQQRQRIKTLTKA